MYSSQTYVQRFTAHVKVLLNVSQKGLEEAQKNVVAWTERVLVEEAIVAASLPAGELVTSLVVPDESRHTECGREAFSCV